MGLSFAVSWSGGKDSYLALHTVWEGGGRVGWAVHMLVEDRPSYHGPLWAIMAQASSMGIQGLFVRTSWSGYEEDFKETLRSLARSGVEAVVFGDMFLEPHREWVERVCREAGLEALEPLWGMNTRAEVEKILGMGVRALIVRAYDEEPLSRHVGRILSPEVVEDLERGGYDPAGERGEYHTLVLDAPLFSHRIEILEGVYEKISASFGGKEHRYLVFRPTRHRILRKASGAGR